MNRPSKVILEFIDPWSGELCLRTTEPYSCHEAALGFYSFFINRMISELPKIQTRILQNRKPKIKVTLLDNRNRKWINKRGKP